MQEIYDAGIATLLDWMRHNPWRFATAVVTLMVAQGLFLGAVAEIAFRVLGIRYDRDRSRS